MEAETVPLEPLARPPAPAVAVVLSRDTFHYRAVADALGDGRWQSYVLDGSNGDMVLAALADAGHTQAIAIGHEALALLDHTQMKVAYCQVFDVADRSASPRRGVAPLPDFESQLEAWLVRQPALTRIGLVVGPAHESVALKLESAAQARALEVRHAVVGSDRELLHVFRRMVPEIQGFVLYPDTSILSPSAIRELLAYSRKHQVRVLTYSRAIYELGADLLVTADPAEVARKVVAVLDSEPATGEVGLRNTVAEARHVTAAARP